VIPANNRKLIEEHFGHTTQQGELSLAHMKSPPHWKEPFQTQQFNEYT